ncbi:MAG: DUF3179 domain-containing protein [Chloroflexota bacterium]|nr:MAG: DUF3179 domain-containing protein [Chloroflexota bacterium]
MKNKRYRAPLWLILGLFALVALTACSGIVANSQVADSATTGSGVADEADTGLPEAAVASEEAEVSDGPAAEPVTIDSVDDRSPRLRQLTADWNTDFSKHSVSYDEILSGGPPRDGIRSIDNPKFIGNDEAADWLADNEPVIALELNDDARAYPLQIITWHEIVNDTVGDVPAVITFCPLCNSALAFDRRVGDQVFEFGVSGLLRNSDLIMYDRTTETLWQQFTGDAIVGELTGERLTFLPTSIVSFRDFRDAHPDGQVLSQDTGLRGGYGSNPYAGYDTYDHVLSAGGNLALFQGETDGRLEPAARVVTVSLDGQGIDIAYPYAVLEQVGVVNDSRDGQDLVVFFTPGTASALGARVIADAEDVGATGVFDPNLDGQKLIFRVEDGQILDDQTGSAWNILGQAIEGPLAGESLEHIVHGDHFWFSWAAFKPDTIIYQS